MLLLASSVCCLFKRRQFDPEVLLRSDCHRTETVNGGSVATLQLPRGSLAGCSSWRLRFAVYSNGVNSTRRSSSDLIATAPKPSMAEVLQLCSYPVVVSPDAPPGVFGLLSIQTASIRPGGPPPI